MYTPDDLLDRLPCSCHLTLLYTGPLVSQVCSRILAAFPVSPFNLRFKLLFFTYISSGCLPVLRLPLSSCNWSRISCTYVSEQQRLSFIQFTFPLPATFPLASLTSYHDLPVRWQCVNPPQKFFSFSFSRSRGQLIVFVLWCVCHPRLFLISIPSNKSLRSTLARRWPTFNVNSAILWRSPSRLPPIQDHFVLIHLLMLSVARSQVVDRCLRCH